MMQFSMEATLSRWTAEQALSIGERVQWNMVVMSWQMSPEPARLFDYWESVGALQLGEERVVVFSCFTDLRIPGKIRKARKQSQSEPKPQNQKAVV